MIGNLFTSTALLALPLLLSGAWPEQACAGVVAAEDIRLAVVDTLAAAVARSGLDLEVTVGGSVNVAVPGAVAPRIEVEPPALDGVRSRVQVTVFCGVRGSADQRTVCVFARVRRFAQAVVVRETIPRGAVLDAASLTIERVDVTGEDEWFADMTVLADMVSVSARPLHPGRVLSRRDVVPIPVVRCGDTVTIRAVVGGATIAASGVARENGGRNELIRVRTVRLKFVRTRTVVPVFV